MVNPCVTHKIGYIYAMHSRTIQRNVLQNLSDVIICKQLEIKKELSYKLFIPLRHAMYCSDMTDIL